MRKQSPGFEVWDYNRMIVCSHQKWLHVRCFVSMAGITTHIYRKHGIYFQVSGSQGKCCVCRPFIQPSILLDRMLDHYQVILLLYTMCCDNTCISYIKYNMCSVGVSLICIDTTLRWSSVMLLWWIFDCVLLTPGESRGVLKIFIKTESLELWLIILYIGNLEPQKTFLQYWSVGHSIKLIRLYLHAWSKGSLCSWTGDIMRALPCAGVYLLTPYASLFLWFYIGSCFCEKTSICWDNTFVTLLGY